MRLQGSGRGRGRKRRVGQLSAELESRTVLGMKSHPPMQWLFLLAPKGRTQQHGTGEQGSRQPSLHTHAPAVAQPRGQRGGGGGQARHAQRQKHRGPGRVGLAPAAQLLPRLLPLVPHLADAVPPAAPPALAAVPVLVVVVVVLLALALVPCAVLAPPVVVLFALLLAAIVVVPPVVVVLARLAGGQRLGDLQGRQEGREEGGSTGVSCCAPYSPTRPPSVAATAAQEAGQSVLPWPLPATTFGAAAAAVKGRGLAGQGAA